MNRLWQIFAKWLAGKPALVDRIVAHARKHPYWHIQHEGDPYMSRFWIVKERRWLPFAIRLHEWHRPDRDPALHDHPCDYRTIILRGAYFEEDIAGVGHVRSAGDTVAYRREHMHRVFGLTKREPTFSLFIYWGKHQPWGFLHLNRKMRWSEYILRRDQGTL